MESVACPRIVTRYHELMGGVDRDDQLRLLSHSLQLTNRFRKYCKSLFFGLVDMAVVNSLATHTQCRKDAGSQPLKRAEFMTILHEQMLSLTSRDFEGVDELSTTGTPLPKQRRVPRSTQQQH